MRWFKWLIVPGSIVAAPLIVALYMQAHQQSQPVKLAVSTQHRETTHQTQKFPSMSLNPGIPTRLLIDKIGVDANVEDVGINTLGEMEDPHTALDATWYKLGYLPGALGNAVIAGHYVYQSKPALFYRLHELAVGDSIMVQNDQRYTLQFRVTDAQHVQADAAPYNEIFGKSSNAQLRLVTCFGKWDKARQRYEERLIVTAAFIREVPTASLQ